MDMHLSKFWEKVGIRGAWPAKSWGLQRVGHDLATKQQQQFLTIVWTDIIIFYTVGDMGMNEL